MNFANYNAFRVAFQHLFQGDDSVSNTFSTDTMDLLIGMGESRVFHGDSQTPGLRASSMLSDLSVAVTANAATLPSDLLELKEVRFDGEKPLEVIPLDRLRAQEVYAGGGDVRVCAQDGDTLRFFPAATGTVLGRYYARPAALESIVWANATTFARYPELFLYAALFEGAIFLGMVDKMPMWETRYRSIADGANHAERMRVYGGGPLRVRAR